MISAEFLMTSLIVVLLPGTGVIYTICTGLFQGGRASLYAALGCTAGIIPHLLASTVGLAFLPQFVPLAAASPVRHMLVLSAVFMAMTLIVFMLYGLCANGVRAYVVNSPRVMRTMQRTVAVVFASLGAKLAFSER